MAVQQNSSDVRSLRSVAPLCKRRNGSCLYVPPFVQHVPCQRSAAGGEGEQTRTTLREPACSEQPETTGATGDEMALTGGISIDFHDVRSVRQAGHQVFAW